MADRNLVLQLLITAKDQATAVFSKLYSFLNDATNVTAGLVRDAFTNLFSGGIDSAADFEKTLDAVAAKGGYTREEMARLTQAADQLGAEYGMAGGEVAKGMEILAAAGLSARDVIATLPPVLSLAKLEGISLDAASTKLADSLSIMGLSFEHAGRMADVLAKGANITLSSASQLADALTGAGGAATSYGLSLEQTVAALDLLHKNGIKGAEAGTALKTILLQLLNPTSNASQAIAELGGNARDFDSVLEVLSPQTEAAKDAILKFGSEATPALFALRKEGVEGMTEFTGALRNAAGSAQDASAAMSGNLKSAMEALAAAWDALKRNLLAPLLEPLAKEAQTLTARLNDLAKSDGIRQFGEVLAAVVKTSLDWLERLANDGLASLQRFTDGLSFTVIAQKVADAKDNLTALISAGLDATAAKFREVATGIVQTTSQLVVDIKTGLIGLLDGIRQLPIVQGEAFDKLTAAIKTLKQGLPELAAVAKAAGEQSAAAQTDYNAALAQTKQAYSDLTSGATAYERSVREGAQRMGVSEAEYINYLNEHAVELQKLIPLELERLQTTTDAQAELLQQTQKKNEVDQAGFDLAKTLAAAGVEATEIKRLEALAAGDLTTALQIEAEQKQAVTAATQTQTAAEKKAAETAAQAAKELAEAVKEQAERQEELAARGDFISNILSGWAKHLNELSPAARQAFDGFRENANLASGSLADLQEALRQVGDELAKIMGTAIGVALPGGIGEWARDIATKALEIEQSFINQRIALLKATEALRTYSETGELTATVVRLLQQNTRDLDQQFSLLNEQDLDQLRGAIADANDQLREMQDEARSAQDRLAELNAEIAREKGDTATAERLRLELEQRQALAELELNLAEARNANNRELVALYEEQRRKLLELYGLKERNLLQEQRQTQATASASTRSTTSTASSGGTTINVSVDAGGAQILDSAFISNLARQLQPEFERFTRRIA